MYDGVCRKFAQSGPSKSHHYLYIIVFYYVSPNNLGYYKGYEAATQNRDRSIHWSFELPVLGLLQNRNPNNGA